MRRVFVVGGLTTALFLALTGVAGGGETGVAFSYSPQSGPAGTVITVSGTGCDDEVASRVEVVLSTQGANGTVVASAFSAVIPGQAEGGNWTVMLTVPVGTPPGTYDVQAFCESVDDGDSVDALSVSPPQSTVGFITYAIAQFVIPTTPPVTAAPAPVPTAEPAPVPVAPPAPMVAATPRTAG